MGGLKPPQAGAVVALSRLGQQLVDLRQTVVLETRRRRRRRVRTTPARLERVTPYIPATPVPGVSFAGDPASAANAVKAAADGKCVGVVGVVGHGPKRA